MRALNVAVFTDNDFEKVNGVTTVLKAVLAHRPQDIRPRIYTSDSHGADRPDYLALRSVGVGLPYYKEMRVYLPPFLRFLRAARRDRIDVVHYTTPGPVGLAALFVARQMKLPLIGSFHTHLEEYTRQLSGSEYLAALVREYMRWPYGKCARILVPSEATRQVLHAGRIDPDKIAIWSRGVSTTQFNPAKRSEGLRERWRVSDRRPAVLYVGRLSREKGLAEIAGIQNALQGAALGHRFIFVGDGPMRRELEQICPDAVFTGTLTADHVASAMASADVFLFPSRTDTAGNVVLEAQASGLPVLVSNEGGPREHMQLGRSGEVCRSVEEFSARLIELIVDPERRRCLARGARAYAAERSWERALEPLYRSYREVQAAHPVAATYPAMIGAVGNGLTK